MAACGPLQRHPLLGSPPLVSSHHQRLSGAIPCHRGDRIHRLCRCRSHSRHSPPPPRPLVPPLRWHEHLNMVVDEVQSSDRLNPYNHSPHFRYLVTPFMDSMPISSIGGALSDVLSNPKYAGHIWKRTVAVDHLGNIVWIGPLMPSTAPDVIIWDKYGPSRKLGRFKDFEVGNHDGAYTGRMHSHTPFIGRKVLTKRERE